MVFSASSLIKTHCLGRGGPIRNLIGAAGAATPRYLDRWTIPPPALPRNHRLILVRSRGSHSRVNGGRVPGSGSFWNFENDPLPSAL